MDKLPVFGFGIIPNAPEDFHFHDKKICILLDNSNVQVYTKEYQEHNLLSFMFDEYSIEIKLLFDDNIYNDQYYESVYIMNDVSNVDIRPNNISFVLSENYFGSSIDCIFIGIYNNGQGQIYLMNGHQQIGYVQIHTNGKNGFFNIFKLIDEAHKELVYSFIE